MNSMSAYGKTGLVGNNRSNVPWLDLWPNNDLDLTLILSIDDVPDISIQLVGHATTKNSIN